MMQWKLAGTLLIAPAVVVAAVIAWKTRDDQERFLPNLAVCFWIIANSIWMLGEFFQFNFHAGSFIFFITGVLSISWYYARIWWWSQKQ